MSSLDVDEPQGGRRRARREGAKPPREGSGWVVALVALLLVAGLAAGAWYGLSSVVGRFGAGAEDYAGPGSGEVVVEVVPGQSAVSIGQTLKDQDVVASVQAFADAARADPRSQGLQPGFYGLQQRMPAQEALALMLDPASRVESTVTLPEGLRLDEALEVIADDTDLPPAELEAAVTSPEELGLPAYAQGNAEGFLFPATYTVRPDATATRVLTDMVTRFGQAAESVGLDEGALPAYETLIIASLIEAEARLPEDYPKVARVVHNRLDIDMPLQFDSTVNYALQADKELVTLEDLGTESPYNTYQNTGLPPAPISSPGEAAMQAALEPAEGGWLYFVTVEPETGETKFTDDYDEFLQFKAEYKANTGS